MNTVFTPHFKNCLALALAQTYSRGIAVLDHAITRSFLAAWSREVEAGPFEPLLDNGELIQQQFERYSLSADMRHYPLTALVHQLLGAYVAEHSAYMGGLEEWEPNEVAVQRYGVSQIGITPHRDYYRDRILVAVFTVTGRARFRTFEDYDLRSAKREWMLHPGSLALLRAPGLSGGGRPIHAIDAPTSGERISVALRYNSRL